MTNRSLVNIGIVACLMAQIEMVQAPRDSPYVCESERIDGSRPTVRFRVFQDRGRYRVETIDLRTGKNRGLEVYNRDGQGLDFYYWGDLRRRMAGVDIDGLMYRLARDNPKGFYERTQIAYGTRTHAAEPRPGSGLVRFTPHPDNKYRKAGTSMVSGKLCEVWEPGVAGPPEHVKVWNGVVMEQTLRPGLTLRVRRIEFVNKLPGHLFELLPGSTVKVPKDLKVRLPPYVRRIEYPGNGLTGRGSTVK